MGNSVTLFTDNFPYGKGETFLENEISYLSQSFDTVYIIPLWQTKERRYLPDNIVVKTALLPYSPKNKIKLILHGLFNLSPIWFTIPIFFKEKAYCTRKRIWTFFTAVFLIRSCLHRLKVNNPDTTILYFYWGYRSALLVPFLKTKATQMIVRFHRSDIYEEVNSGYIPFRQWLFKNIDIAVPISNNGKQYLFEKYRTYAPKKIIVSHLGVADKGINPPKTNSIFHIVTCSNLISLKRVDLLAKALLKCSISLHWTHIGDGIERKNIEELCSHFPQNITYSLLGQLNNKEVLTFYQMTHVDAFLNVSTSEGIPVSIMEAISFGIPIIATNVGGTSEIVSNKIGVLLSCDISSENLRMTIESFAGKDNTILRIAARKEYLANWNAEKNYTQFIEKILLV